MPQGDLLGAAVANPKNTTVETRSPVMILNFGVGNTPVAHVGGTVHEATEPSGWSEDRRSCGPLLRPRGNAWVDHRGGVRLRHSVGRFHGHGFAGRVGHPFRIGNRHRHWHCSRTQATPRRRRMAGRKLETPIATNPATPNLATARRRLARAQRKGPPLKTTRRQALWTRRPRRPRLPTTIPPTARRAHQGTPPRRHHPLKAMRCPRQVPVHRPFRRRLMRSRRRLRCHRSPPPHRRLSPRPRVRPVTRRRR